MWNLYNVRWSERWIVEVVVEATSKEEAFRKALDGEYAEEPVTEYADIIDGTHEVSPITD